ncbi:MAG: N,N-dimethylformamidase beta subunit family domain-containing protein, partial [Egibacteraceae bacterium]
MAGTVLLPAAAQAQTTDPCSGTAPNAIACENSKPGTPQSVWDVFRHGDDELQGFATSMSVNKGSSISFKIDTVAPGYRIDIYRLGYYQGNGARLIASNLGHAAPQRQPACLTDSSTGLIDCGNWAASATWNVPSTAVSGVYFAKLTRSDRNDGS